MSSHAFSALSITAVSTFFALLSGYFPYGIQCSNLFWLVSSLWPVSVVFVDTKAVIDRFLDWNQRLRVGSLYCRRTKPRGLVHLQRRLRVGSGSKVSAFCYDVKCIEIELSLGMRSLYGWQFRAFVSTFCNSSHRRAAVFWPFHTSSLVEAVVVGWCSSIYKHYNLQHNSEMPERFIEQFHTITKCSGKFDCLVKEMLYIRMPVN